MIAKMAALLTLKASSEDPRFVQLCLDVLEGKCARAGTVTGDQAVYRKVLLGLIDQHCGSKTSRQPSGRIWTTGNSAVGAHANGGVTA
jgi:hypothetical protein